MAMVLIADGGINIIRFLSISVILDSANFHFLSRDLAKLKFQCAKKNMEYQKLTMSVLRVENINFIFGLTLKIFPVHHFKFVLYNKYSNVQFIPAVKYSLIDETCRFHRANNQAEVWYRNFGTVRYRNFVCILSIPRNKNF